jgi:membrane protease YdiL (CAAX protease family)
MTLRYPELPEAARPRWPAWYAPVAMLAGIGVTLVAMVPLVPVIVLLFAGESLAALALLILILVQDTAFVGVALMFALLKLRPRAWHFGIRPTRLWPTAGWTVLGFGLLLGFELGYVELFDVDVTNVEDPGEGNVLAATLFALAAIVVAPVAEEFFFRGFFYRALRTRLRVWSASLIDGVIFGALHFQGADSAIILPVIGVFGVGMCLLYERTGSLFAVIAVHAAFNAVATVGIEPLPSIVIGLAVLAACLAVPRALRPAPSPVPA